MTSTKVDVMSFTDAMRRRVNAVVEKVFPRREPEYFEIRTIMASKYSDMCFDRMMELYQKNSLPGQSFDDYWAETVGTPKTIAWAKQAREESQRKYY